jgi:hypothetical protein
MPFTSDEIHNFIEYNNDNIEKVINIMINIMIKDYSNDNDLELLANPLPDWITEYLYDFVDTIYHY